MAAKVLDLSAKLNDVWFEHDVHLLSEAVFRKFEKELYTIACNAITDGSSLIEVNCTDDGEIEIEILRPKDAVYGDI